MTTRNLYQIQEMYYFRTRIPVDLRLWFNGQEDFKRSLKTKSLKQARRLLRVWNFRTEETFTLMRCGMLTDDQIKRLAENYKHNTLSELEQDRTEASVVDPSKLEEQIDLLQEHESEYREALASNDLKRVSKITNGLIDDNELGDVSKTEYAALSRELLKKMIEVFQVEQQRMVGNYQNGYDDRAEESIVAPSVLTSVAPSTLLSVAIDKHIEDLKRKEAANELTILGYTGICSQFLRIVGDVPVQEITRDTLRGYLDTLKQLPPNLNKLAKFKGKSIQEIITINEGGKVIATDTITKTLTVIKTFFSWMLTEDLITRNHSDILKAPKKETRADEERKVYSTADLQNLLKGLRVESERGKLTDHPERYWLPLIGLFSGMRLGEIAQLHTDDVTQIDDVWCFSVKPDAEGSKQVKTNSSQRILPIHETLIDLGFIDYFKSMRDAGQPRLWMKLTRDNKGKWYKNFSNWFLGNTEAVGFLRKHITKDDKKDFHSFRHTFINTLKQLDVAEVKISELVGHTNSSMTSGRYGKRYEIAKMKETIDSLHYEGVEFQALALPTNQ